MSRGTLLFGPFRLDRAKCRLERGGVEILLPPKTLDLLIFLVSHAGELVTRERVLEVLWPGTFVDDHALSVQIGELRKALGDPARRPVYIETRHRRGYCFIAPVSETGEPAKADAAAQQSWASGPIPETRYTCSGNVNLAYQVTGEGPVDIVFVMGWVSHLEYFWTEPRFAGFLRRLARFSRLILFDKRGTGLSDRVPLDQLPTIEQRMTDLRAVMDAAGSERAIICGVSEGGCMSAVFAATYPERTMALIMIGSYARRLRAPDYPWGPTPAQRERFLDEIRNQWGGPVGIEERMPSLAHDPQFRQWWAAYLRMGASPGAALALTRMNSEIDIRQVLPLVGVPSLVLHRSEDRCLDVEEGRYVASLIPGSRFVELPGADHLPFTGDAERMVAEIAHFASRIRDSEPGHVLATVLAADFHSDLDSPAASKLSQLAERFDASWSKLRDGEMIAAFDGPARAVRCACAMQREVSRAGMEGRVGLHTGECIRSGAGVGGTAVEIAAEVRRRASDWEVLVSGTVRDLVAGSGLLFHPRGRLEVPGRGEWQLLRAAWDWDATSRAG